MAASQAKAEQVAELAEFNENIPLDDGGEQEEVEELSKAEQEIAALVEQVSHIAYEVAEKMGEDTPAASYPWSWFVLVPLNSPCALPVSSSLPLNATP